MVLDVVMGPTQMQKQNIKRAEKRVEVHVIRVKHALIHAGVHALIHAGVHALIHAGVHALTRARIHAPILARVHATLHVMNIPAVGISAPDNCKLPFSSFLFTKSEYWVDKAET
jgi:hypothetical protein